MSDRRARLTALPRHWAVTVSADGEPLVTIEKNCLSGRDKAYHKGEPMLARWLSNHARATMGATMVLSHGPGKVEVDGRAVTITQAKKGKAEPVAAAPEGK